MLCNDSCRIQWVGQEDTYVGTDFTSFGSHDKNWFKECIGSYQTLALRHYYLYFQLDMEIVRNLSRCCHLRHQRRGDVVDDIGFDAVGFGPFVKGQPTPPAALVPASQRTIMPACNKTTTVPSELSECFEQ